MLTDYQIGRIQQFTDSVRAGNYIFPQNQLRELAVILDEHMESIEKMQKGLYRMITTPSHLYSLEEFVQTINKR